MMITGIYKGYELQILPIRNEPNGHQTRTVHAFKNGVPVKSSFAVIGFENVLTKIKVKILFWN